MIDFLYQDAILDHYRHPHHWGGLTDSQTLSLSNPSCGDMLTVYLIIEDGLISDISFTGTGCAISVAAGSMLSDVAIGKSVKSILAMDKNDIISLLGVTISPAREKCATLALELVKSAVTIYAK